MSQYFLLMRECIICMQLDRQYGCLVEEEEKEEKRWCVLGGRTSQGNLGLSTASTDLLHSTTSSSAPGKPVGNGLNNHLPLAFSLSPPRFSHW